RAMAEADDLKAAGGTPPARRARKPSPPGSRATVNPVIAAPLAAEGASDFSSIEVPIKETAHYLNTLRAAVVDAATDTGPLWLSYLFALLYLLIAAGGITHRDLFLESPVKLPFLSVDLPLIGFAWLGPVLFIVVHVYLL